MQGAIWWLASILVLLGVSAITFIWVLVTLRRGGGVHRSTANQDGKTNEELAKEDVDHVFNDEFREELRNMGRLYFQRIINENAMFLQQDLRLTSSQLNDYMKSEVQKSLQREFAQYQQTIKDAQTLAIEAIQKTSADAQEQRDKLTAQFQQEVEMRKVVMIENFQKDMADVVTHYLLSAIGEQIDIQSQMEYILGELKENKDAIVEDMRR